MNHRILGLIGMLTSPMLLLGLLAGADSPASRVAAALGLVFVLGWMCSMLGLRLLRATGSSVLSKTVFIIQMCGLLLAASQQVQDLIYANPNNDSFFYRMADAAWPLSVLFMLVVGILTVKAKVLKGWRKFAPLVCGLALPVLFLATGLAGMKVGGLVFGMHTTVAWMLLGYAARTGRSQQV